MRNVDFRVDQFVVLRIRRLVGALVSTRPGSPPVFDDKTSFVLQITSGEIAIDAAGLSAIMNRYAFAAPDAPMKGVSIEIRGEEIRQKARLRKTGLPVEIAGRVDATPDGRIRLRPESIRVAHLPVRGLITFLKLKLGKLMDLTKARGVEESGNDLVLSPDAMLPPPRIKGMTFSKENPGVVADVKFTVGENFYVKGVFIPLTTPVSYLSSVPIDGFSKVVPYGFDTRETPSNTGMIAYFTVMSCGPDKTDGDWYRGNNPQTGMGCHYDPSNGTISRGDIWRALPLKDPGLMRKEYPFDFN
jgi:hypothetical protein